MVVVNIGYAFAELLANLSHYPGLGFLRNISTPIERVLENYNNRLTEAYQAKMRLKRTKERATELGGEVGSVGEAAGAGEKQEPASKKPAAVAGQGAGGVQVAASATPGPAASAGVAANSGTPSGSSRQDVQPAGSDSSGTLSLDNFMQESQAGAEAPGQPAGGASGTGAPAEQSEYYGTMAGPQPFYAEGSEPGRGTVGAVEVEEAARQVPAQPAGPAEPSAPAQPPPGDAAMPAAAAPGMPAAIPAQLPPATQADEWAQSTPEESLWEEDQPPLIPRAEREEQLARLEYVCHWLREARQPLCPVNGVVAVLPLQTLEAGPRENVELQRSVRADLTTLQDELQLRFPASALLVGLEADRGFEELVRRVGPQRAGSQRFGHRFDVRTSATPEQLAALCGRISGVFEDWVYAIFRERGSIARPGNSHLFGLLCRVRSQLQGRLWRILSGGFGSQARDGSPGPPIAFSGCYFAATGRTADRRAFVRGVFDKLVEEQDQVEWTQDALQESRRFRWVGWLGMLIVVVLAVWLAYTLL